MHFTRREGSPQVRVPPENKPQEKPHITQSLYPTLGQDLARTDFSFARDNPVEKGMSHDVNRSGPAGERQAPTEITAKLYHGEYRSLAELYGRFSGRIATFAAVGTGLYLINGFKGHLVLFGGMAALNTLVLIYSHLEILRQRRLHSESESGPLK